MRKSNLNERVKTRQVLKYVERISVGLTDLGLFISGGLARLKKLTHTADGPFHSNTMYFLWKKNIVYVETSKPGQLGSPIEEFPM